ncbi:hypothetical protein [Mariniflexile sp.]|uniref:hypothetical protein n=1 Tax=Mariniflexile sp. TaxID=1979402 RepID=UPI0040487D3D
MKNLESFGVLELDAREIKEIDGGIMELLKGLLLGLVVEIASNPKAHWESLVEGSRSWH